MLFPLFVAVSSQCVVVPVHTAGVGAHLVRHQLELHRAELLIVFHLYKSICFNVVYLYGASISVVVNKTKNNSYFVVLHCKNTVSDKKSGSWPNFAFFWIFVKTVPNVVTKPVICLFVS